MLDWLSLAHILLALELVLWAYVAYRLGVAVKAVTSAVGVGLPLRMALHQAMDDVLHHRLLYLLVKEIQIWRHAIFGGPRRPAIVSGTRYTLHRQSSYLALCVIAIHEQVAEGLALHFMLAPWHPWVAWLSDVLHVYSIVWLLGDFRALRVTGAWVDPASLTIVVGLRKRITIPLTAIRSVAPLLSSEPPPPGSFIASALPIVRLMTAFDECPQILVGLRYPVLSETFSGRQRSIDAVYLRLDKPAEFTMSLSRALNMSKEASVENQPQTSTPV